MKYVQEEHTIPMNGNNTPGAGMPSTSKSYERMEENMERNRDVRAFKSAFPQDLNGAFVPLSKEDGGNLKKTEEDIQYRFCLEERGLPETE